MYSTKHSGRRLQSFRPPVLLLFLALVLSTPGGLVAQADDAPAQTVIVTCASAAGDPDTQRCDADTSTGVLLQRSVGSAECVLGRNWGYDDQGVWVSGGCSGEFLVAGVPLQEPETVESAEAPAEGAPAGPAAQAADAPAQPVIVTCTSVAGDPDAQRCEADTSTGVLLQSSFGAAECVLGRNWGYDDQGVWVSEGCSGEFLVPLQEPESEHPEERWGFLDPGKGFLLGKGPIGELSLSAYALVRYMNQMDDDGIFFDHLGRERPVKEREDIFSQRVLVWLSGWVGVPKLEYLITFWALNATNDSRLFGNIGYNFNKHFKLYGGVNGNPGSRSVLGSHPYWLGHDRVMADEFFRAAFTFGIWANGEIVPGLLYDVSVGNSSTGLGSTALDLDRKFTYGGSVWWMPTTKEFGPRGAFGDWEMHEKLATRFGFSVSRSPEQRYQDIGTAPTNSALKLVDSVNLFETGALVPDITVTFADYALQAFDAGLKYRGFFLQTEFYWRSLDGFEADGPLPVSEIGDWGFYVQAAFFPIPKKLELYGATSQIYGDEDAGFGTANEYLVGLNFYITNSRNHRLNLQVIDVNRSTVDSAFGYYTGGQVGTTVALAASVFF